MLAGKSMLASADSSTGLFRMFSVLEDTKIGARGPPIEGSLMGEGLLLLLSSSLFWLRNCSSFSLWRSFRRALKGSGLLRPRPAIMEGASSSSSTFEGSISRLLEANEGFTEDDKIKLELRPRLKRLLLRTLLLGKIEADVSN